MTLKLVWRLIIDYYCGQGKVCLEALQHELIHPVLANNHGYSTGSCIVLSGMSERSFVTDRGCVNEMSLEWYGEKIRSFQGISHVHAAGYFNCQKLMTELPNYFREVGIVSLFVIMVEN